MQVGQRIIEVNGQSLLGASHNEAVSTLREVGDDIQLLVCDGWNTPTPATPEPIITSDLEQQKNSVPSSHYNSSTQNGQIISGVDVTSKITDSEERPSSVNGEKV